MIHEIKLDVSTRSGGILFLEGRVVRYLKCFFKGKGVVICDGIWRYNCYMVIVMIITFTLPSALSS